MTVRVSSFLFALVICQSLAAQSPVPASAQKNGSAVLLLNGTAHVGNGTVINNSAVAFENGKLVLVADATGMRIDRSKYAKIFDVTGKHVYPGFIASNSTVGLVEIEAVRPTVDYSETGNFNPNIRAIVAYNTDSDIIPTVRSNGVLMAQSAPTGGGIAGTSAIVQLDAWNWEDAAYKADDGIHLYWPTPRSFGGFESGAPEMRRNDNYDKEIQSLRTAFEAARAYAQNPAPAVSNLKLEAMRGLFNGSKRLFIHTDAAKTIQESVLFAEGFGLSPVLVSANDAWMTADFLKAHGVPVILGRTQRIPDREDEDYDLPYKTASLLQAKGILFAFSEAGAWRQRNLPFHAGQAAGFGLSKEAALSAVTLNAAKILGIEATCGSLEVGKDATLFISDGDALDMRTNKVNAAFIGGREISLDDKHKQLNRRFEAKYKRE
jgi:imidazolonepropionase-like amidohydrolase